MLDEGSASFLKGLWRKVIRIAFVSRSAQAPRITNVPQEAEESLAR